MSALSPKLKVLYHAPYTGLLNAYRSIDSGYAFAFEDMGHSLHLLTAADRFAVVLNEVEPDLFITASHFFYRKQIDFELLRRHRNRGMKVLVKVDFWNSPLKRTRFNEAPGMSGDDKLVSTIRNGDFGDVFFHVVEQGDPRMEGFQEGTGYPFHTIPLAADRRLLNAEPAPEFKAHLSFIGTNLPQKRAFFRSHLFPLRSMYDLRLYGQDWTLADQVRGWLQRLAYFSNLSLLKQIRRPNLSLEQEGRIYASSTINLNIHEDYQRVYGGDCNERTFKIPLAGGFQVADSVGCIATYFREGREIVVANDLDDWFEKINYYIEHPDERKGIIDAGRKRVLAEHTYHHRVARMLALFENFKESQ